MTLPISVVIPTFKRHEDLFSTLNKISKCFPKPDEIIVHVDGNDTVTIGMLVLNFPNVVVCNSMENVGPGGGRNIGIGAAKNDLIASFDDDSFPLDDDYFDRLYNVFLKFPDAALIESAIYHRNELVGDAKVSFHRIFLFTGCGVAYRRSAFIEVGGYIPIPCAYGIEESDFSLRAFAQNQLFVKTEWLRVFHDTDLQHHSSIKINQAAVANLGLLVFLRYPVILWPFGLLQIGNRIVWAIKYNRLNGLLSGLFQIPKLSYNYRFYKNTISIRIIMNYLSRRNVSEQL